MTTLLLIGLTVSLVVGAVVHACKTLGEVDPYTGSESNGRVRGGRHGR